MLIKLDFCRWTRNVIGIVSQRGHCEAEIIFENSSPEAVDLADLNIDKVSDK